MAGPRIGCEPDGSALGAVFLECRHGTVPGKPALLSDAEIDHRRDLIDGGWNLGLGKLRLWTKGRRGAGTEKCSQHALGIERAHHIRPNPASRMPPETPGDGSDLPVSRLCRKFVQSPQEGPLRTTSGIEPQFRPSGRQIDRIVEHAIGRSKKYAVPFLRQSLPVQIIGGRRSRLGRRNTGTVLVNDHRPHGLYAVGNPKRVGDTNLQLPRLCRRWIDKLKVLACTAGWREGSPFGLRRGNPIAGD